MPVYLKSLVVILVLATAVFAVAKTPAIALMSGRADFLRRRNTWLGLTLAAFLSGSVWVFVLLATGMLIWAAAKDGDKVGFALFLLLAIPPISAAIPVPGTGKILFDVNYLRLICLVVLLPAFIQRIPDKSLKTFLGDYPGRFLFFYLSMNLALIFWVGSWSGALRTMAFYLVDALIPYVIASRLTRDMASQRKALAAYVTGAMVLAAIGVVESGKSWLLYPAMEQALDVAWDSWDMGAYMNRGGHLRAQATAGQAIPFGYAMAVGFCLMLGLRRFFARPAVWLAGLGLLGLGLLSSLSRGPWAGAAAGYLVYLITGPRRWRNLARLAAVGAVALAVALVTPLGDTLASYLLFDASNVDEGSYTYRARLLEIGLNLMMENPIFGAYDYFMSPALQELRQGQGIVDVVNAYLTIGMSTGLVGLTLYAGFFVTAVFGVWGRMRSVADKESADYDIGRALISTIVCIMVTIFTVSLISYIPLIYYLVVGLAAGYAGSLPKPATAKNAAAGAVI